MLDNEELKRQIKKDKARLKELKRLNKQNALSVEETWEYTRLLNEDTDRIDKLTKKLQIVTFVINGINFIILIIALIIRFVR